MSAHFLEIVDALLSTHLWLVTILTNIFSHLFVLPLEPLFWKRVWKAKAEEQFPLRDGKSADHFSSSLQSPSLASGVDSRQRLFNIWKSRSLNRESLCQWAEAKEASAYMASIGRLLSASSLPLSSSFSCRSWSLDSRGLLVENAATVSPPSSLLSSAATGILQGDVGTGTPLRTRSRTPRTLKRPLASLKQRGDGDVAPRPLFPSTVNVSFNLCSIGDTEEAHWGAQDIKRLMRGDFYIAVTEEKHLRQRFQSLRVWPRDCDLEVRGEDGHRRIVTINIMEALGCKTYLSLPVSCPSLPLSLPASSPVSALPSAHIHSQALGKRARKKVHSIMLKEAVVDHGVKSVSRVGEVKGSAVPALPTMTGLKMKSANEKTPLTSEIAVPVIRSTDDERKSSFFPASSSSAQNSEFQSEVSSTVKAQQMGVRSDVGGFLRAELSSNASAKELRTNPPLNQVGTALQAQYSRTTLLT